MVLTMNSKTRLYSELKPRAITLRKEGKTFSEIRAVIGKIPKGTLSGWLKHIELTQSQKIRIRRISAECGMAGRHRAGMDAPRLRLLLPPAAQARRG